MGDAVGVDAMNERCLPVLVHECSTETDADLPQSAMCRCLYKSDGENAIKSLKQHANAKVERNREWRRGIAAT